MAVNPLTYSNLNESDFWGAEAMGEVWAEILWVVAQHLIQKHGFSETLFPPESLGDGTIPLGDFYKNVSGKLIPKHGNTLMLQLAISSMKLLPCRPTFFNARDAMLLADRNLTGGENTCDLWRGFVERGLGPNTTLGDCTPWGGGRRLDDFAVPETCL